MINLFVLKPNEDWICDRFYDELKTHRQFSPTEQVLSVNLIEMSGWNDWLKISHVWAMADWCLDKLYNLDFSNKKVVRSVHHLVPSKVDDKFKDKFKEEHKIVNLYHVPSLKTKQQLIDIFDIDPNQIWHKNFWVNQNVWKKEDVSDLRKKLFKDNDFVVGSFQRDSEGSDLSKPKLEKGPDLFVEFCRRKNEELNKDGKNLVALLGGWRRDFVKKKLTEYKIKFLETHDIMSAICFDLPDRNSNQYITNGLKTYLVLNKMYNLLDLYVVSARYEGGPMSVLEASNAKIPLISTDCGMSSEILSQESIAEIDRSDDNKTVENLLNCVPNVDFAYSNASQRSVGNFFIELTNKLNNL